MFCQLNIKQNVTLLILVNIFILIFLHALTGSLQVKTSTPKKNNNNKNHKKNFNLSLLTSYFRPDRSLPFILFPVWRPWFSCQPIKKLNWSILLEFMIWQPYRWQGAKMTLGSRLMSANERCFVINCCRFHSPRFEIS